MSTAPAAAPGSPADTSASPASTPRHGWWAAIPRRLGRARTSTVVLAVLFVAVFALWLNVKPPAPGATPPAEESGVSEPAAPTGTTEPAPTEEAEPTEETAPTTPEPAPTTRPTSPTTTAPSAPAPTTTAPETTAPETTAPAPTGGTDEETAQGT